jgi:hypothetical protein
VHFHVPVNIVKIKFEFHISNDKLLKIIWQNLKEKERGKERNLYLFINILILFSHFHLKLKIEFKDLFNY